MTDTHRRIDIKPASFGLDQRQRAVSEAEKDGMGVEMWVFSGHTEFFASPVVPAGKIAVYSSKAYKGWPTYDGILDSPDDIYTPEAWRKP